MKILFIYFLTCVQFLSSCGCNAQNPTCAASVIVTDPTLYTVSYTWDQTHPSPLSVSCCWARSKHPQMAHVQGAHLLLTPSLHIGKVNSFTDSTFQNSPYRIRFKKDGPLTGAAVGLYGAAALLKAKEQPLSTQKVLGLGKTQISRFDRGATRQNWALAQQASNVLLYSSIAMPLLYLTQEKTRKDFSRIFIMQAETILLTTGLITLTKTIVFRPRPFTYNTTVPLNNKLNLNAKESFFSGHVATSASMSFFIATTFSAYFPHSQLKPFVWTYAIVWPAATGYFRYAAGKHFPTDILTGYIVGAVTGIVIPKIHQKIRKGK